MNLALLGPPGCGKGTQSVRLSKAMGFEHLSTGDILRAAVRDKTVLGKQAEAYMSKGQLVPDEVMMGIVKEKIGNTSPPKKGFLLDGFPRNISQAKMLDEITSKSGESREKTFLDFVVSLEVSEEECIRRLADRKTCPKCGATYNPVTHPPKREGQCDRCGSKLVLRKDDKVETVKERFKVYNQSSQPLIQFYDRMRRLYHVNGASDPVSVFDRLIDIVKLGVPS